VEENRMGRGRDDEEGGEGSVRGGNYKTENVDLISIGSRQMKSASVDIMRRYIFTSGYIIQSESTPTLN
jgi:hypothetical protein